MGAAEIREGGPSDEGAALKLNAVIVGAADKGPCASGADEAKLNEVSTSMRSVGDDGISTG